MLAELARQSGYAYQDEASPPIAGDRSRLAVCTDVASGFAATPDRSVVIAVTPSDSIAASRDQYGLTGREGLAHAAHCLAHAATFARASGAALLSEADLTDEGGLRALAYALGLAVHDTPVGRLMLSAGGPVSLDQAPEESADALRFYEGGMPTVGRSAWWDRGLFWSDETDDRVCPESIDISGRGRILTFGPFLALPPGRWRATLRFVLSDDAARRPMVVDFGVGDAAVSREEVWPSAAGRYEVAVDASWNQISLAQVRLWMMSPALSGSLHLEGARIAFLGEV